MDKFSELITFVEVVNAGSITKAADRLGLVKSAVSRRLNDLESRLKVQLLIRSTTGLSLTEVGMTFYARAVQIVNDLADAELTATDASTDLSGTIRMTAPVSLTNSILMPPINAFLKLHPKLTLDLNLSDRFIDIINEGFDLAIRAGTLSDSRLVARKLTHMQRITCASPHYLAAKGVPTTPIELENYDGLVSSNAPESQYWNYKMPDGSYFLAQPTTRIKANNGEAIITAAVAGLGIAAVPEFISQELITQGVLLPILTDYTLTAGGLYAIYPPNRYLSHRVRLLIDFLVKEFNKKF